MVTKNIYYDIEKLKEVDIVNVAEFLNIAIDHNDYGYKGKRRIKILCPAHNDAHFGSCFIFDNSFHCFACGAHGNVINLAMHVVGDFKKACEIVAQVGGGADLFTGNNNNKEFKIFKFLKREEHKLIGLNQKPLFTFSGDSEPHHYEWFPDENNGYEIAEYLADRDPLRTLAKDEPQVYEGLVLNKCLETIDYYKRIIKILRREISPSDAGEIEKIHYEIAEKCGGVMDLIKILREQIRKVENIYIDFGGKIEKQTA